MEKKQAEYIILPHFNFHVTKKLLFLKQCYVIVVNVKYNRIFLKHFLIWEWLKVRATLRVLSIDVSQSTIKLLVVAMCLLNNNFLSQEIQEIHFAIIYAPCNLIYMLRPAPENGQRESKNGHNACGHCCTFPKTSCVHFKTLIKGI